MNFSLLYVIRTVLLVLVDAVLGEFIAFWSCAIVGTWLLSNSNTAPRVVFLLLMSI